MPAKRIGKEKTVLVHLRIPGELHAALMSLTDGKNPLRAIMRDALARFAREYGAIK